jgi:DNA repair photolyase
VNKLVNEVSVKSLLNKHKKPDDWFLGDYTLNPYMGCSMGCIYCYTRGSKYGGDQGTNVSAKSNAVHILKKQLKNRIRKNERGFIVLGSAADPYPAIEMELKLTCEILGMIKRYRFPLHILTKSTLVLRDIEILYGVKDVAILPSRLENKLDSSVILSFSFSTLNEKIAKVLEPDAPSPIKRLKIMKKFSEQGFKTGIINMPILPFISDSEEDIENMVIAASDYGADYVMPAGLTLFGNAPDDCKTLYYEFLNENYPNLVSKSKNLYRGSFATSRRYQNELSNKFGEISGNYGVKNSIL